MSLINEMLTDLEKRRAENKGSSDLPEGLKPADAASVKKKKLRWQHVVAVLIIIAFIVFVVWEYLSNKTKPAKVKSVATTVVAVSNKKVVAPTKPKIMPKQAAAVVTPGLVTAVTINQKNSMTTLAFALSKPLHYQMQVGKDHLNLNLTIDAATFKGDLPKYAGTAIKQLNFSQTNHHARFSITLLPGADVKTLQLNKNTSPKLELKISIPPKAAAELQQANAVKRVVAVDSKEAKQKQQFQAAVGLISKAKYAQADTQLKALLTADPSFDQARQALALLQYKQSKTKLALATLSAGLKITPASIGLVMTKAQILVKQKKLKEAKDVLQTVSPNINQYPGYYELAAAVDQRLGIYDYAAQYYQQLIHAAPETGKYWLGLGVALQSSGKPNAAVRAFQQAIETKTLNANMQVFAQSRLNDLGGQ